MADFNYIRFPQDIAPTSNIERSDKIIIAKVNGDTFVTTIARLSKIVGESGQRVEPVAPGELPYLDTLSERFMEVDLEGDYYFEGILLANNPNGYKTLFWWDGDKWEYSSQYRVLGEKGDGVEDATINNDGDLIITYTDGVIVNAGHVKGDKGDPLPYSEWSVEDVDKLIEDVNINAQRIPAITAGVLPTPPQANMYMVVTDVGDYTYGGTTIGTNADGYQTTFWWDGTAWSLNDTVELPKPENKIDDWEAGAYNQGDQRIWNGQIWSVAVASTTEEPGTGTDWVADIDKISGSDLDGSIGKNKFDKSAVVHGKFINPSQGYAIVSNPNTKMTALIDISTNDSLKKITVSGLQALRWDFAWIIKDGAGLVVLSGVIPRDSSVPRTIDYTSLPNGVAKTFEMTVFSGRTDEVYVPDTIQIEFSAVSTPYEEYKFSVSKIKGNEIVPISSTFAEKVSKQPVSSDDITPKSYVDTSVERVSNYETQVLKDDPKYFGTHDVVFSSDTRIGWIRNNVTGLINQVILNISHNSFTPASAVFRFGYFNSSQISNYNETDFVELSTVTVEKTSLPATNSFFTIDFPEITIPEGKIFAILAVPLRVFMFNLNNPNFAQTDHQTLYQPTATVDGKWSYGYRFSYGITVNYINTKLESAIKTANLNPSTSKVSGLNIAVLGDSITQAVNSWAWQAMPLLDANFVNLAVSGAKYADYTNTVIDLSGNQTNNNNTFFNQVLRLAQRTTGAGEEINIVHQQTGEVFTVPSADGLGLGTFAAPDVIVIAMSTNDTAIDTVDEILNIKDLPWLTLNRATNLVYGMRWGFEALKILYPNAQIIVATPIQAASGGTRPYIATNKKRLRLIETANYYSIPVIDAFVESGIQEKFEVAAGNGRYLADGLHPNDAGKALMRDYFIDRINKLYFYVR